jgi:hypothetical protein
LRGDTARVVAFPISRGDLPECKDDDVIEIAMSRVEVPNIELVTYLTYHTSARRIFVSLAQVVPSEGESFKIEHMRIYGHKSFVEDYNANKPKGLENTDLSAVEGKLTMTVDKLSFDLEQTELRTVRGVLRLEAKLPGGEADIVFSKKLNEFSIDLKAEDKSPNKSMTFTDGVLLLAYETTHSPFLHHRRIVTAHWDEGANGDCGEQRIHDIDELMTPREIRGWIDGEGYINSRNPSKSGPQLTVAQNEEAPLRVMEKTFRGMGILSRIYFRPSNDSYVLEVLGWENIARVIAEVGPFRTANRRAQVEEFKRNLSLLRKKTHASTKRARRILGIS